MKSASLIIFFFISLISLSQTPIGYTTDTYGVPFYGFADMNFKSFSTVTYELREQDLKHGKLVLKNDSTIFGYLRFIEKNIKYKPDYGYVGNKFKPTEVKYIIFGKDSIFPIIEFYKDGKIKKKNNFFVHLTKFDDKTYAIRYNYTFLNGTQTLTGTSYFFHHLNDTIWKHISLEKPDENGFIDQFGHIGYLSQNVSTLKSKNIDEYSIIKMIEYEWKRNNDIPLLYDSFWRETTNPSESVYSAKITNRNDSIWTFDYYKGQTRLYTVNYSSFFPTRKEGKLFSYYKNGGKRNTYFYKKNKLVWYKHYDENGELVVSIHVRWPQDNQKKKIQLEYKEIISNSTNILKNDSISYWTTKDDFLGGVVRQKFKDSTMIYSRREFNNKYIYQIFDKKQRFNTNNIQGKFGNYITPNSLSIDKRKLLQTQMDDVRGHYFVYFIINPKGKIEICIRMNDLHPELDQVMDDFIKEKLFHDGRSKTSFPKYNLFAENQYYEFVIPFYFSIDHFEKDYDFNDPYIHQYTPPNSNIPSGF